MNISHMRIAPLARLSTIALLASLLSACNSGGSSSAKSSQVVATVNGQEITTTQLNHAFESAGVREVTPETRKRALESLTSEELLVQAALKNDIDRDAGFVQALEASRRHLLAQYFAEKMIYPKTVITSAEVSDYYNRVPVLFAQRRKFKFTTFRADASDVGAAVTAELQKVNSVDHVRGVLEAHNIKYVTEVASVSPEQLPVDELDQYANAKVGDLFINPQAGGQGLLMSVTGVDEDVPMTLERATPLIEEYLTNSRNRKAAEDFLAHARAAAKIEYAKSDGLPGATVTQSPAEESASATPIVASRLQ